jgi:hypothetical protein
MDDATLAAIEATDFSTLQRIIDGHCQARDWDALDRLRVHCRHALERGKQLWAVEEHIRYRLALEAPGEIAARIVEEGPAKFTLGPLTEVAASTHTWGELERWLGPGPWRSTIAHERAVRGEDLEGLGIDGSVFEVPLALQAWEPDYPVAEYKSDRVEQNSPDAVPMGPVDLPEPGERIEEPESSEALRLLTAPWVEQSSGRAETVVVEGEAHQAVAALGLNRAALAPVTPTEAMAWMAWAASVGGRYGRRRGSAAGRFSAWWAAAHLTAVEWPPDPDELGNAIEELGWYLWSDGTSGGWAFKLAIEDPEHGIAWATGAIDTFEES